MSQSFSGSESSSYDPNEGSHMSTTEGSGTALGTTPPPPCSQSIARSSLEDITIVLDESTEEESPVEQNGQSLYLQPPTEINIINANVTEQCQADGAIESGNPLTYTRKQARRWGCKNVCGVSISMVIVFTSFVGLQNLQSSINSKDGLGLVSLSVLYVFFILSGFISPCILKIFGTKYSLLIGFLCHLQYTMSNYYPSWYTLIPSSMILGIASGPLWAAANCHFVEVATTIAPILNKDCVELISKFSGIFFFFFQWAQIPGNLASSLIFYPYNGNQNGNDPHNVNTGDNVTATCNVDDNTSMEPKYLYILVSVYIIFIILGTLILLVVVDKLPKKEESVSSPRKKFDVYLKMPLIEVTSILGSRKMMLMAPMALVNGLELSFSFGTFTEVYISDCFGTYQVGFTLMVLGTTSAIMSLVYGQSMKYIPRFGIVLFGAVINVSFIVFLLAWERVPSYAVIFLFVIGWGAADAVWNTISATMIGILYPNYSNSAFSAHRVWLAFGIATGFTLAELISVQARLWILLGSILLAVVCYIISEITTQSKSSLLPCLNSYYKQRNKTEPNQTSTDCEVKQHGSPEPESCETSGSSQLNSCIVNCPGDTQEDRKDGGYNHESQAWPKIDDAQLVPNNVRVFECDSLDGTFPSWSTES